MTSTASCLILLFHPSSSPSSCFFLRSTISRIVACPRNRFTLAWHSIHTSLRVLLPLIVIFRTLISLFRTSLHYRSIAIRSTFSRFKSCVRVYKFELLRTLFQAKKLLDASSLAFTKTDAFQTLSLIINCFFGWLFSQYKLVHMIANTFETFQFQRI